MTLSILAWDLNSSLATTPPYNAYAFWYPDSANYMNIGVYVVKPYTTQIASPPAGWTVLGGIASGTIAAGSSTGSTRLQVLYRIKPETIPGTETYTGTAAHNPVINGNIYAASDQSGSDWVIASSFGADTDLSTTAVSVTGGTTLSYQPGDLGIVLMGVTSNISSFTARSITVPGCTVADIAQLDTYGTTDGNDLRVYAHTFSITAGTATGPPSMTTTASTAALSSVPVAFLLLREPTGPPPTTGASAAVSSPPASIELIERFASIDASLEVTATTSGMLRAMDPATAASEGLTAPVEVQIWRPDNARMLAVADGRMHMEWLDDLNDAGSSGFDLSRWDPKATAANLALFNLVRFVYAGRTRFASRIEQRQLAVSASGDHAEQVWQISGRGVLAMLADAALYPEYGVDEFTRKQRSFFFGSKEGPWYVASEWFQPRGMPQNAVPADHPWHGHPADWPDPDAQWIWPTDPNALANPGPVWFRSKFTLLTPETVTVYASADDEVTLYVDGFPALATVAGEKHSFRRASQFSIRMGIGEHLVAAKVNNTDASLEEVQPIVTSNEVRPTYATDSNKPYVGKGFTDGGHPYVNADGSVDGGGPGGAAFDGDENSYWMSVGNYLGWSSAYEWVEGTFPKQPVTAVRVKLRGGPYTVYISLKNGDNGWNGGSSVPYRARAVDAGTAIRYVREIRVGKDENVTINVPAQDADRIRITLKADWDSGIWQYRWRGAIYDAVITSEKREGSYIRGGNFAGLLVSVCFVDDTGAVTGVAHRSRPEGWLCRVQGAVDLTTGETGAPGWRPSHILTRIIEEAKARNVLGVRPLKLGFTNDVDSYGMPWKLPRKDVAYGVGDDYLSIAKKLAEDSRMDVWIEPDTLILHAAPERGEERTDPAASIILRPGQSLTDFTVDSGRPQATRLLMESDFGWLEVADFEPEATYGRVEGLISLGNALSLDEARAETIKELDRFALETYDTTVRATDVTGPRPYIDYDVGDRVLIPTGIGGESEFGVNRVLSFRVAEGDAGELDVTVEADREFTAIETGKVPVVVPPPITALQVLSVDDTSVTLSWANPTAELGPPIIRRARGGTPPPAPTSGTGVTGAGVGDVSLVDEGVSSGTTYSYAIWAVNTAGTPSDSSSTVTATTTGEPVGGTGYGVPPGTVLTTLTTSNNPYSANTFTSSVYKINTSGTFTGWRFEHRVEVIAGTVEFINCYFAGAAGSLANATALMTTTVSGTGSSTATNCTFNPTAPYSQLDGVRGNRMLLDACDITRTVDGMQLWGQGDVTIQNTWIHDLIYFDDNSHPGTPITGSHNDAIQISSGSNYQFINNLFTGSSNACVFVSQNLGAVSDLLFDGNTFDFEDNGADININDANGTGAITGITITDNSFVHDTSKYQILITNRSKNHASTVISGNVWMDGSTPPPTVTGG